MKIARLLTNYRSSFQTGLMAVDTNLLRLHVAPCVLSDKMTVTQDPPISLLTLMDLNLWTFPILVNIF